jgi:hypothetical protein
MSDAVGAEINMNLIPVSEQKHRHLKVSASIRSNPSSVRQVGVQAAESPKITWNVEAMTILSFALRGAELGKARSNISYPILFTISKLKCAILYKFFYYQNLD